MARRLRYIPEGGALVEVTCRTMQCRFLLKPSDDLKSIIIGVLARAQRLYPVELHTFVFLSNHYHRLLSVDDAPRLARFMNFLNSNLAREAGRVHRWREKFWGRRYGARFGRHLFRARDFRMEVKSEPRSPVMRMPLAMAFYRSGGCPWEDSSGRSSRMGSFTTIRVLGWAQERQHTLSQGARSPWEVEIAGRR